MSVTGAVPAQGDLLLHQVEKVANSSVLKSSESLCRLLRYLAEQSSVHSTSPIKEYQIATEVFGRADPAASRIQQRGVRRPPGNRHSLLRFRPRFARRHPGPLYRRGRSAWHSRVGSDVLSFA